MLILTKSRNQFNFPYSPHLPLAIKTIVLHWNPAGSSHSCFCACPWPPERLGKAEQELPSNLCQHRGAVDWGASGRREVSWCLSVQVGAVTRRAPLWSMGASLILATVIVNGDSACSESCEHGDKWDWGTAVTVTTAPRWAQTIPQQGRGGASAALLLGCFRLPAGSMDYGRWWHILNILWQYNIFT